MTTLFALLPGSSAITFTSVRVSDAMTLTRAVDPGRARSSPSAKLAPTTGIVGVAGATVPTISASRSGELPWLKMMSAAAPADWALVALRAKLQPPR